MSVFKNLRIYPNHGKREAAVVWEMADDSLSGDVWVAFSPTGTQGSWEVRNQKSPVPAQVGYWLDENFVLNGGTEQGFYRLMLETPGEPDRFSEPFQVTGDITAGEYGIIRGIIHREFLRMRATNGFPVWHCIPRESGELSESTDPDTGRITGLECGQGDQSYGLPYAGGFYPPVLTWIHVLDQVEIVTDSPDDDAATETVRMQIRMMAFPAPRRSHMLVDPSTDRRWLVDDKIKVFKFRGIVPVAYETSAVFLNQRDQRYRVRVPEADMKQYRRIPDWPLETA